MRAVTLSKPYTSGNRSWPAGLTISLPEQEADALIVDGKASEQNGATAGTATIPNGSNSVIVPHALGRTPSAIELTGTHSEVSSCIVTSVTAASITIQTGGGSNVTANRNVYWGVR